MRSDCCESCQFFKALEGEEGLGWCRRYPPTYCEGHDLSEEDQQPIVDVAEWCGEYQVAMSHGA